MISMRSSIPDTIERFFDRELPSRVSRAKKRELSRGGAFVRRRVRSSIRRPRRMSLGEMSERQRSAFRRRQRLARQGLGPRPERPFVPSRPGEPPRRGPQDLLRQNIFFSFDPANESVVVGPARLGGRSSPEGPAQTVPELLEFGGAYRPRGQRRFMQARPYMGPGLEAELDNFPGLFEDSIRGAA